MFLLVSVRYVGAHPGEHHNGVSIQISISLGRTFPRISRIRNIPLTWILARVFVYVPPFISQILDFICWMVWFFFWCILNGVTLKTSNLKTKRLIKELLKRIVLILGLKHVSFLRLQLDGLTRGIIDKSECPLALETFVKILRSCLSKKS